MNLNESLNHTTVSYWNYFNTSHTAVEDIF